jgi:hypothetical protein
LRWLLLDDLLVDDRRALSSPFFLGHRAITDDVLAEHVVNVLHISPVLWIAVLQPEDAGCDVGRHVLDVMRVHEFFGAGRHEDLHCIVVIAIGSLAERARRAKIERLDTTWDNAVMSDADLQALVVLSIEK